MLLRAGVVALSSLLVAAALAQQSPPTFDPGACTLRAEVQTKNVLQLFNEFDVPPHSKSSEALPDTVAQIYASIARADVADIAPPDMEGVTCRNFFHHIDRLPAPKGRW